MPEIAKSLLDREFSGKSTLIRYLLEFDSPVLMGIPENELSLVGRFEDINLLG